MAKVCQPTGILSKKESSSFSSTLNSPSPLIQQSSPSWKNFCHQSKSDLFFFRITKFKLLSQMFRFDHDKESSDTDDEVHTLNSMPKIPIWKLWHKASRPSSSNISDFTRPGPSASCCAGGPNSRKRRRSGQSGYGNQDGFAQQQSWQRSRMFTMHMQLQNCMGCRRAQFAKMARSSSGCSGNSSSSSASTSSSGCSPSSSD